MPSTFQIERNRGSKEARQQLAVLRDKWPLAFPADAKDVRPPSDQRRKRDRRDYELVASVRYAGLCVSRSGGITASADRSGG